MGLVLASQRGHHAPLNNAFSEEETRERLSSLIRQNGLTGGRDEDCYYWVLLAESPRDRFVILEGIHESCCLAARSHEFQLVAVGSATSSDDGCLIFWPGAKELACVVNKIMRRKRNAANDSEILRESAIRGLPIYHIVGFSFSTPEQFQLYHPPPSVRSSIPSLDLELEMQMQSRALKPPTVLAAAASPALLAQGPLNDDASSFSAPLALVSEGMDINPSETAGYELPELAAYSPLDTRRRGNFLQELAVAPPQIFTRSSGGGRGRNGGVVIPPALIEAFVRRWWNDYDLQSQRRLQSLSADYDLEAGALGHRVGGGGAAAPVQEPSEVAKMLEGVMVQTYAAFIPACVTAYPLLKDAPDYVKFTIFGGLAFTTVGLFAGILSRSVARRGQAIRLVSFWAIAVLTFSVASQLSSHTYIALTALVGLAVNLVIMLLPF